MSLDAEVEALKKVPLFRGVDDTKLRLLAFISERVSFRPGERLCEQGERGDAAYIILDGAADIVIQTSHGNETVATVKQNDVVGEIAILIDVPRTATVVATSDVLALAIAKENFLKLLKNFPDMAIEVMRVLAHRLERTTREVGRLRAGPAGAEQ
ncbi:cyclic nucleotide-binding domain-containing protein [Amorphus sp. 3PC139-8]|uniref:cyclic nucleotide-binding domain-containing protein n=1 Tax=Amorphus sp. 3PC139-8 TaxID=2735676 RepID=UPI00345D00C6